MIGKNLAMAIAFFAIFGMALIDGGSILFAKLQLNDLAETASIDGAAAYGKSHNAQAAFVEARSTVATRDANAVLDPKTFEIDPRTATVTITLTKTADTLFLRYIGPLKKWADLTARASGRPPTL